jgi:hypothetical protein
MSRNIEEGRKRPAETEKCTARVDGGYGTEMLWKEHVKDGKVKEGPGRLKKVNWSSVISKTGHYRGNIV